MGTNMAASDDDIQKRKRGGQPKPVRPVRIEGDVAYVTLTKGYVAVIDAADAAFVGRWNWCVRGTPHTAYANRTEGRTTVQLHREIMGVTDERTVDHRSCDGLDNRRSNLRIADGSQQQHNKRRPANNGSGFKGVHFFKRDQNWRARLMVGGKRLHLGSFETPELAHAAYVEAAKVHFGEFARAA